jgi:hypothetical protein
MHVIHCDWRSGRHLIEGVESEAADSPGNCIFGPSTHGLLEAQHVAFLAPYTRGARVKAASGSR